MGFLIKKIKLKVISQSLILLKIYLAQLAGAVEYIDCFSVER